MRQDQVRKLEESCEVALGEILRRHYPVDPRVARFMAKAAVAVLEGVEVVIDDPPGPVSAAGVA